MYSFYLHTFASHSYVLLQYHNLTFIVWHLNSVFMLRVWNFLRDGPLNRRACLTINVYIL